MSKREEVAQVDEGTSVDTEKRKFIAKASKYAVVGAGMATLMTPAISSASNYSKHCKPKRRRKRRHRRHHR